MIEIVEVLSRTFLAFVLLYVIGHFFLGKSTISQMTLHDFIATLILGAISANLAFNTMMKPWNALISLVFFSFLVYLSTIVALKNRKARALFSGEPTIIIENGKILEENLKKLKYTMDSLNQSLREKDVFDIEEVQYAVVEADGHLSVLKKPLYRNVTVKDLNIVTGNSAFPIELIMDGKWVGKNLQQHNIPKDWVINEVTKKGLQLNNIFYCVKGTNGQLYFDVYDDKINNPLDTES
ncbi:DUF421 domain-containing protein [Pseudalkalibacillus caeni]|uniref:DUF421 domain-containing protein n=1 Tax=Exobacillus caeni TaxID=2574798 RepID=A0A5R9F7D6_9BACL|nr:DUF421 domain-containing protein [Pseudalkalibacillus caeni]TLS36743.1 DUF421 domain-containing protein [Pseudalkalibacillus caeni]